MWQRDVDWLELCLGATPNQVSQWLMGRWSFLCRINGERCWPGTAVVFWSLVGVLWWCFPHSRYRGRASQLRLLRADLLIRDIVVPLVRSRKPAYPLHNGHTLVLRGKGWQCRAIAKSGRKRRIDRWILCVSTVRFYVGYCLRQAWERAVACCNDQHLWMLSLVGSPIAFLDDELRYSKVMGTSSGRTNTSIDSKLVL